MDGEVDRPDRVRAAGDIIAGVEHPPVGVRTLGIEPGRLEHAAALIGKGRVLPGWPRLARRIVDVPAPIDEMKLRRPDVGLVPSAARRRPDPDGIALETR